VVGRFAGTGVGLASARDLVELYGGTMSVESDEGKGSTFVVRLPLAAPTTAAASL
jgi:signal transduction histidine kinase